ncbi:MAG: formate--tetrahydrofolate ligase [Chloroflexi bacterium]|nr:formate--tetrahydrofolate ligase [Chloroflexota bacterium]
MVINKTDPNSLTGRSSHPLRSFRHRPDTITWRRMTDTNDRMLRGITIGQGPAEKGHTRETGYDITVASEIMAILALSTSLADMRERIGAIVIGMSHAGLPHHGRGYRLRRRVDGVDERHPSPYLDANLGRTPAFVHAGPFANIAHGNSSIVADRSPSNWSSRMAMCLPKGFGADIGMEKFFNIKCRYRDWFPIP